MLQELKRIKSLFRSSKYSAKIYIDNLGFQNRGDELMIQSVLEQIHQYRPDAQILVRDKVFEQNPTYCIKHKLYPLDLTNTTGVKASGIYARVVNFLLRDEWICRPQDVDMILDCRGYHLADCWIKDEGYAIYLRNYYKQFSKKCRKMVLLPQAFGPYSNTASQKAIDVVYHEADIVYAREQQSFDYLRSQFQDTEKVRIVPDFTCLCNAESSSSIMLPKKQYVLIIPNSRMVDKTEANVSDAYMKFIIEVVEYLSHEGESVYMLNHEGRDDEQLLCQINEQIENPLPILTNLSGAEIKALIKDCKLLISARYHGVVSGLTQGVPTLCTSWSHKYAELLQEHECEENMMDVRDIESAKRKIHDALQRPTSFSSKQGCEEVIEGKVKDMWGEIFNSFYSC